MTNKRTVAALAAALLAGGVGLGLRLWLYAAAVDDKGLLRPHPARPLVWVLTGLMLLFFMAETRKSAGPCRYKEAFPPSVSGGAGCFLAAAGILSAGLGGSPFRLICTLCAAGALVFLGVCRIRGAHPAFFFSGLLTLFFAVGLLLQYRQWSSDPQLQDYGFQLLARVFLMLFAFQKTAFDAGMGRHSSLHFYGLGALYLCCLSLNSDAGLFYLGCGCWTALNLSRTLPGPGGRMHHEAAA